MTGTAKSHLLIVKEAADYCRLSASTLNRLRVSGDGPRYTKLSGKVLYDVRDLDKWIEDSKRGSTSERAA
jgi:hypothetical protein